MGILSLLIVCSLCLSGHGEESGKRQKGITFQRYKKRHSRLMQDIRDIEKDLPDAEKGTPDDFQNSAHQIQSIYDKVNIVTTYSNGRAALEVTPIITLHLNLFRKLMLNHLWLSPFQDVEHYQRRSKL